MNDAGSRFENRPTRHMPDSSYFYALLLNFPYRMFFASSPQNATIPNMTIIVPFLVCIIGLLAYALSSNSRISEVGRIAYAFGLLVTLLEVAGHVVSLLK